MINSEFYMMLVDFLGQALGPNCEIVLHDVSTPEKSIIAIANGNISGRRVGAPLTDLVLKVMSEGTANKENYLCNYTNEIKGGKICRSSSFFIRDEHNNLKYVLCLNFDITPLISMENFIHNFTSALPVEKHHLSTIENIEVFENLSESIGDVLQAITDKVLLEFPEKPDRMSVDERIEVIKRFNDHGIFLLKGGVPAVAASMNISEATVYRYMNKLK